MRPWMRLALCPLRVLAVAAVAAVVGVQYAPGAPGERPLIDPLGIRVIGQRELLAGGPAAVRVVLTDHRTGGPVVGGRVVVSLSPPGQSRFDVLFRGQTDSLGTAQAAFQVPDVEPGEYDLRIAGRNLAGSDETVQRVQITRRFQILLTTDKPIYQPGQTMHLRALALRQPSLWAVADADATLEVKDAKGNKVLKQPLRTNAYGIAATDFILADEVNMGRYTIRCLIGKQDTEKTVTVERYVLPKYDVKVTTDQRYYLPGQTVKGTVQCDYFYGVPVRGAHVEVSVKTFDVEYTEIAQLDGDTDDTGTWKFETELPKTFVGQPVEQGNAFLQFDVKVTSKAKHVEKATATSTVAAQPIRIDVIPESGTIVPGVANVLYIMTTYPDGSPAPCAVTVHRMQDGGRPVMLEVPTLKADDLGLAELKVKPETNSLTLNLGARTKEGESARTDVTLTSQGPAQGLLLRLDRRLAKVGDTLHATVLTSGGTGAVYLDVIKDRQTMLTKAAEVTNGQASIDLPLTTDLSGSVWLNAYRIQKDGQIIRDTAPAFIDPASDLSIDVKPDRDTYRPGQDATVAFAVRDPSGKPIAAALGINVVDESVFALQELKPGMEKVFFYLEQELMKPRVEIHEFDLPTLVVEKPADQPAVDRRDRAAHVLLASVEMPDTPAYDADTYTDRLNKLKAAWAAELKPKLEKIQQAIQKYREEHNGHTFAPKLGVKPLLDKGYLTREDVQDQWGQDLVFENLGLGAPEVWWYIVHAIGPDGQANTEDDIFVATSQPDRWVGLDQFQANGFPRRGGRGQGMMLGMGMGGGGMMPEGGVALAGAAPGGMAGAERLEEARDRKAGAEPTTAGGAKPVRVRKFFPETMFSEPSLITDENGRARLSLKMADSITTWRMTTMANSAAGQLGSTTAGLRCFQDFFVDLDLPVALTQNDRISIPVMVFNHLDAPQDVRLELTKADWFDLQGDPTQTLKIGPKDEAAVYFTITAKEIGDHPLTVHAYGSKLSDAIERRIEVRPDGQETLETVNDRLNQDVTKTITIPRAAIDGASDIMVKVYSGIFSQAVEGLDSILQMPFGCFEQTSSTTYPNILVLDYMKTTGQVTPEVRMKAEGFINLGYQRLVSFEVPGGGFSWFGEAPANQILTAYGLLEFKDMSAVHEVDDALISRTAEWLFSQQQDDGAWKPDAQYLHQESWGRIQNSKLLPTAYCSWALGRAAPNDPRVTKAVGYLKAHAQEADDPYTLALVCNSLVANVPNTPETEDQLERLLKLAQRKDGKMWWESKITGITHSSGQSADLEATGLAALALVHSGTHPSEATEVLNHLIATKDPRGTWYSTQATVLALRSLLDAQKGSSQKVNAEITVLCNGEQAAGFAIDEKNADVVHFISLKKHLREGDNEVRIKFAGEGSSLYQITSRYYLPWKSGPETRKPVAIGVQYDKTELAVEDMVTANVTIKNNTPARMGMVLIDLGIPPGFEVQSGDLAELVGSKVIQKFTLTGRQIIVYLEELRAGQEVKLQYRLRAKFPIKAKTPDSTAYEYYNPDHRGVAQPVQLEVKPG